MLDSSSTNPVGPVNPNNWENTIDEFTKELKGMPGFKPLPPSNPWVKMLEKLFPAAPPAELGLYAAQFQKNFMNMMQTQIDDMTKKAKEASQAIKDAIEGNT